jgi:hypothetical protein
MWNKGETIPNTKIIIKRISVKIQKLSIRTLGKKCNNKKSQFPFVVELFEIKSDLEDCNLFLEDYNEYNATNKLI